MVKEDKEVEIGDDENWQVPHDGKKEANYSGLSIETKSYDY